MTHNKPAQRSILSRYLATLVLVGIYCVSIVGVSTLLAGASSTSAFARGGGGRVARWRRQAVEAWAAAAAEVGAAVEAGAVVAATTVAATTSALRWAATGATAGAGASARIDTGTTVVRRAAALRTIFLPGGETAYRGSVVDPIRN